MTLKKIPNSASKGGKWYPEVGLPILEANSREDSGGSGLESPGDRNEKFINIMITESVKNDHRAKSAHKVGNRNISEVKI